jgi:hypothetical protein
MNMRDRIKSKRFLPQREVLVDGWGENGNPLPIRIRKVTYGEMLRAQELEAIIQEPTTAALGSAHLIQLCACNPDGSPIFLEEDITDIAENMTAEAIAGLVQQIMAFCFGVETAEGLEKNLETETEGG